MIELPNPDSIDRVADWIELKISVSNEILSKASLSSIIEQSTGSEPDESFVSSVWRELEYRQGLYAKSIFVVSERFIEPKRRNNFHTVYYTCLLLSLYGGKVKNKDSTKLFEKLICYVIKLYLSGKSVVFGWPDIDVTKATSTKITKEVRQIEKKLRKIAQTLNEKFVEAPSTPHSKDRGVDVIGWIPFDEKRSGQVIILIQCATGHNWKDKKAVPLDAWCKYIHWGRKPVHGFAVPCIITEHDWVEISSDNGLLIDRARIINIISGSKNKTKLFKELDAWIISEFPELRMQD